MGGSGAGDAMGVAWAIAWCPMFPCDAWPDGAATAVRPKPAIKIAVKAPVLSRFKMCLPFNL